MTSIVRKGDKIQVVQYSRAKEWSEIINKVCDNFEENILLVQKIINKQF